MQNYTWLLFLVYTYQSVTSEKTETGLLFYIELCLLSEARNRLAVSTLMSVVDYVDVTHMHVCSCAYICWILSIIELWDLLDTELKSKKWKYSNITLCPGLFYF